MKQTVKSQSHSTPGSTSSQTLNVIAILGLVFTLLLNTNIRVSAGTNTQGAQNIPYQTYLPITLGADDAYENAYFVSSLGNDANPGTILCPWKTIGKASSMVRPGDTVYIRGGTYNEIVHFTSSGNASSQIRILAYPGENPIIDGNNIDTGQGGYLLWIQGDYIFVSGLEVRNSRYGGVYIYGNYDVIDNVFVHHNMEPGITISHGYNSTVENSRVWRNALSNEYGQGSGWSFGLSTGRLGVSYATIRHNTVWENWGEGISTGESNQIVIEDNIAHDNYGPNIYITDATNILCQRNFVYTDPTSYVFPYGDHGGIMLGDETYDPPSANITIINNISSNNHGNFWWWQGVQGGGMNNVLIANNTFINGIGDSNHGEGGVIISAGAHQNVRFENNIVQQDGDLPVIATLDQPGVTYSNNFWSKTPYPEASGPGDIIGDPLFAHTGEDPYQPEWYKITGVSPAINGALSLSEVIVDFFDMNRVTTPDIGANEFFFP